MKVQLAIKLGIKYAVCPSCGSDKLRNGGGFLIVEDRKFTRECACGWKVETDADGNEVK